MAVLWHVWLQVLSDFLLALALCRGIHLFCFALACSILALWFRLVCSILTLCCDRDIFSLG